MNIKASGFDAKEIKNYHVVSLLQRDMGVNVKHSLMLVQVTRERDKHGKPLHKDPTVVFYLDANEREAFVIGFKEEIEAALRVAGYHLVD